MQSIRPYTIYNSVKNAPSVLISDDFQEYVFVKPFNQQLVLTLTIYHLIHRHFKIDCLGYGNFTLKNVKYFCAEKKENTILFNEWLDYTWQSKKEFNRFLNPTSLLKMFLINLYFPIFKSTSKLVGLDKKDYFLMDAYPALYEEDRMIFAPVNINELELNDTQIIKFFTFFKSDIIKIVQDFKELHHDKLYTDIKYQISLYPEIRNFNWDEVKKCFNPDFKNEIHQELEYYLMSFN